MKGERRLAHLMSALRTVTPAYVRVDAGNITVEFSERTVRVLLNRDDKRYRHRRTHQVRYTKFDIPTTNSIASGDYNGFSEKLLGHVEEHVHTVIRQTRQAYVRVVSALAPEYGLRVLDGEKPEETLVHFTNDLLNRIPGHLPLLTGVDNLQMSYDANIRLFWRDRRWQISSPSGLDGAHGPVQHLDQLLRWVLQVQATARAITTARP